MQADDMPAHELPGAVWRRSSHSGGDNGSQCVEVALLGGHAAVRDSKRVIGTPLVVPVAALDALVAACRDRWR
jgi:hypothetical protein